MTYVEPVCLEPKQFSFFSPTICISTSSYIATGRHMSQVPLQFNACLLLAHYNYDERALKDVSAAHTQTAEDI